MEPRFVEVPIDEFFNIFLRSIPPNAPLEDLQSLIDDEKLVLSEKFPELNEFEILFKTADEREAYPSLVCELFVFLIEPPGIHQ